MKIINNSFKIALAFSLMILAGCAEVLNKPLENQPLAVSADYAKTNDMNLPVLGMYANLYGFEWEIYPLLSVLGDDVNAGGLGDQAEYADTDKYNYVRGYWMYNAVWSDLYKRIYTANNAIEQTLKYKEFAANKALADQYVSEIKVIRAWVLYHLTRLWGPIFIPLDTDPLQLASAKVLSQEEALKFIVSEMDAVVPLLPDIHPNARADFKGGVTKYTALAVKAMSSLLLKNYQGAAEAASAIIASNVFSLEPDFYELFNSKGKLNNENLFEIQAANIKDRNIWWFVFFGPTDWSPKETGAGGGWGFFEPSLKWVKWMISQKETVRLETSVMFTPRGIQRLKDDNVAIPSWLSGKQTIVVKDKQAAPAYRNKWGDAFIDIPREMFLSGKHYQPSAQLNGNSKDYGANKNFVIIRYAEILLMYAEALTHGASVGNNPMTATAAVNMVRERAHMLPRAHVTTEDVMSEKYAELAMEWGIRFADMVRLEKYNELSYDGRTFTADKTHLPYPQGQLDLLPILKTIKN